MCGRQNFFFVESYKRNKIIKIVQEKIFLKFPSKKLNEVAKKRADFSVTLYFAFVNKTMENQITIYSYG